MLPDKTSPGGLWALLNTAISLDKHSSLYTSTKSPSAMADDTAIAGAVFGLKLNPLIAGDCDMLVIRALGYILFWLNFNSMIWKGKFYVSSITTAHSTHAIF